MEMSLAIIILLGLLIYNVFTRLKLPGLLGLLILGIILGPTGFNLIETDLLDVAEDLRMIALIIILLKAGLGINRKQLAKVGIPAFNMSWVPGLFEGFAVAIASMYLLDFSFIDGGMMGFILAAVSPAIIVPSMLHLIETKRGTKKGIPTLILTGASVDDVFAITMFNMFLTLSFGKNLNIGLTILEIPVSIVLGILIGLISGFALVKLFQVFHIRDTKKVLIILGVSISLHLIQEGVKAYLPIAALIGVMVIGIVIMEKKPNLADRLSIKLGKVWVLAEVLLFVLVGAEVNVTTVTSIGLVGLLVVIIGLMGRSIGVFVAMIPSQLNFKERLFCAIAYIPKATVQAATGSIPLAMGVPNGEVMLAVAVIAILFTAPIGALTINISYDRLLTVDQMAENVTNLSEHLEETISPPNELVFH
jgi:solute carrier family 9B (sodium/hydrogen exchanger), member 1/2